MEYDWNATGAMLSGVGTIITAAIAVTAVLFAWRQVRELNRLNAEDKYLDYHWIAFNNPQFSSPSYASIKSDITLYEKYHWFVTGMLMCAERVVSVFPNDLSWRSAIADDINRHREIIVSPEFKRTLDSFYPYMRRFIADVVETVDPGASLPGAG